MEHQTLPDAGQTRLSRGESGGCRYLFELVSESQSQSPKGFVGAVSEVGRWRGPDGGASQGSQDVVMEDGSFHMAATSLNLRSERKVLQKTCRGGDALLALPIEVAR